MITIYRRLTSHLYLTVIAGVIFATCKSNSSTKETQSVLTPQVKVSDVQETNQVQESDNNDFSTDFNRNETQRWLIKTIIKNNDKSVHTVTNLMFKNQGQKYTENYSLSFVNSEIYFNRTANDAKNHSPMSEENYTVPIKDISEVTAKPYDSKSNTIQLVQVHTSDNTIISEYKNYATGDNINGPTTSLNIHLQCDKKTAENVRLAFLHLKTFY